MSEELSNQDLHGYMEKISKSGCADVNQLIVDFNTGAEVPEIAHLSKEQQQRVMKELGSVMKVYDSCEIDP